MTDEPNHCTTIEQITDYHHAGTPYVRTVDVRTSYNDHPDHADGKAWEDLTDEDRDWWTATLQQLHAAEVRLAEQTPEVRERVASALADKALSAEGEDNIGGLGQRINDLIDQWAPKAQALRDEALADEALRNEVGDEES